MALLARAGASAQLHSEDETGARCVVLGHGSDGPQQLAHIAPAVWSVLLSAGFVRAIDGDAGWRLSRDGLAHLKRLRSQGPGKATQVPAREPTSGQVVPADKPGFNTAESPIGWLRSRKDKSGRPLVSAAEFEAGERLRADFWFAHLSPRVTATYADTGQSRQSQRSAPGTGIELRDNVVAAQERVRRALTAVGPELAGVLIDVCCHGRGLELAERDRSWPQRSGKVVLQLALTRLARHYGLIHEAGPSPAAHAKPGIRHWAAEDYRPTLDRWRT